MILLLLLLNNEAAAEHALIVVQHGRLAGRDGALRLIEAYKSFIFKSSNACSLFGIIGKASCE